jgi:hypothetical protein
MVIASGGVRPFAQFLHIFPVQIPCRDLPGQQFGMVRGVQPKDWEEADMREAHRKAAEEHELAAKAHRTAAEHNEKGEDEGGRWHSERALEYSERAYKLAKEAHTKSGQIVNL